MIVLKLYSFGNAVKCQFKCTEHSEELLKLVLYGRMPPVKNTVKRRVIPESPIHMAFSVNAAFVLVGLLYYAYTTTTPDSSRLVL
jgi:hypothetical protein